MATSPEGMSPHASKTRTITPVRLISFFVLLVLLALAVIFFWATRDAMAHLSFLRNGSAGTTTNLVDLRPWQTAQALAPLAVSEEENQIAHQAEHLADHEVDQAFAAALRQARLDAQHRTLSGEALALKQKIADLEQLRRQDQAQVDKLSAAKSPKGADAQDLEVAKAQLGLDSDELEDAQRDLNRASGDDSSRIQDELNAHEESMRKYDQEIASGQTAVISSAQYQTLAAQIRAWLSQRQRHQLIEQARVQALNDIKTITGHHNALEEKASSISDSTAAPGQNAHLQNLQDRSVERQILSIDDDRIQTEQQLASEYAKWSAQVLLQHRIVLHLILGSLLIIVMILIAMLICDAIVRRLMAKLLHNRRQMRTLRSMVEVGVQIVGIALILLVIFGAPRQTPTILGLTTAALTIALQDYIVAFLGWFTLMGKSGIHVGDWVEINGVAGEVVDFKLMSTTLLETGGELVDQGHLTGRRITFMNSYAIRGQFFNFSTAGQWMWDEIKVSVPPGLDIHIAAQEIEKLAEEETRENVRSAEQEWRQSVRDENLARFSASPMVSLRPSGAGIDLQLRFVTAAEDRFELRNRLYQRVIEVLHDSNAPHTPQEAR
jgi:small-conductance mechanosensitive channel